MVDVERNRLRNWLLILGTMMLSLVAVVHLHGTAYNTTKAQSLYPGMSGLFYGTTNQSTGVITGEQPATGTFSQQFFLAPALGDSRTTPPNISIELIWAGNPGAFNIQIQDADTDATGNYVTIPVAGTITSSPLSPGGSYVSRVELVPIKGQFVRLYVNAQAANAVNLIAKITR